MRKALFILVYFFLFAPHSSVFGFNFHNSEETFQKIMEIISNEEKGVYFRFGDGDILLATGEEDSYQTFNVSLEREMREAFALNGPTILKCLPLGCRELGGFEKGMFPNNHEQSLEFCINMLNRAAPIWGGEITDVYSMTALAHTAVSNIDLCIKFLNFLKQSPCCLLVGNSNIPDSIRETLFGADCQFVPTSPQNSYYEIDRIERECLEKLQNRPGYKVIITSMGCSGRVLQKRLWNELDQVFLFDFGSLMDAICGWETRAWIYLTRSQFNQERFLRILEQQLADHPNQTKSKSIKFLYTAALLEHSYETRKQEYIKSLNVLNDFGYEPYIVEACKTSPTFLDEYSKHVCYTNVNDHTLKNKGVNEARSLIEGFKNYDFDDNDMIIKITGRYHFNTRDFVTLVEKNPGIDAFVKFDHLLPPNGKVTTGCFALRAKLFKEMLANLDLQKMEEEMIDIELEMANFIKVLDERGIPVMRVKALSLVSNIGGWFPDSPMVQ